MNPLRYTQSILVFTCLLAILFCGSGMVRAQSSLSKKIRQVENNLLPAIVVEGEPLELLTITDRMKQLRIPGLSLVVIRDGKVEWFNRTRFWGVRPR